MLFFTLAFLSYLFYYEFGNMKNLASIPLPYKGRGFEFSPFPAFGTLRERREGG
jgi:hypothetical protein